jgi:hypothetical protein
MESVAEEMPVMFQGDVIVGKRSKTVENIGDQGMTLDISCARCRWFRADRCIKDLIAAVCDSFQPAPTCPQCAEPWDACHCIDWKLTHFLYARVQIFWWVHYRGAPPWQQTGMTDGGGTRQNQNAPFEALSMVNAEIDSRLAACRKDAREALEDEAPRVLFISELSRPARRALNYISGYKHRLLSYSDWEKQSKYRESDLVK